MILPALVGELSLKEKILTFHDAFAIHSTQSFSNASFEVVLPLVGGVDGSKA